MRTRREGAETKLKTKKKQKITGIEWEKAHCRIWFRPARWRLEIYSYFDRYSCHHTKCKNGSRVTRTNRHALPCTDYAITLIKTIKTRVWTDAAKRPQRHTHTLILTIANIVQIPFECKYFNFFLLNLPLLDVEMEFVRRWVTRNCRIN